MAISVEFDELSVWAMPSRFCRGSRCPRRSAWGEGAHSPASGTRCARSTPEHRLGAAHERQPAEVAQGFPEPGVDANYRDPFRSRNRFAHKRVAMSLDEINGENPCSRDTVHHAGPNAEALLEHKAKHEKRYREKQPAFHIAVR